MRRPKTKAMLTLSVIAAGTVGLIAAGTALANPRPDEPGVYTAVKAPTSIASDAGDVAFSPVVGNRTDTAATDLLLTIKLSSADEGVEAQLTVVSQDDRCTVTGAAVECAVPTVAAGGVEKLKLRLAVADADSWRANPVTTFNADLSGGGTDTAWDTTYIHDAAVDDVERIDFNLPTVIPYDQGEPAGGTEVRFKVNNDEAATLNNLTLTVTIEGLGDEPTLEIDSRRYPDCDETVDDDMTCQVGTLLPGGSASFDTLVYVVNSGQEQNDSVLKTELTWTDDEGATHTVAQRHEYAIISPAEG